MITPEEIEAIVQNQVRNIGSEKIQQLKKDFKHKGVANVENFLTKDLLKKFSEEAVKIVDAHGVERDITIAETNNSPRKMVTVNNARCRESGDLIPKLYDSAAFRSLLTEIAGETVHMCPDVDEQLAITLLTESGNTHGWHWDYFTFGLVWIVESPDPDIGGFIQLIPNTNWHQENPNVLRTILENPIHSYSFPVGSFYFFRSSTTLHRVHPLMQKSRRLIVNMEWASDADLENDIDTSLTPVFFGEGEASAPS